MTASTLSTATAREHRHAHVAPPSRGRDLFDIAVAATALVAAILIAVDVTGSIRTLVALVAWLVGPGWAVARHVGGVNRTSRAVFTFAATAVITSVVALAMVWTSVWVPRIAEPAVLVLAAIAIAVVPRATLVRPPRGPAPRGRELAPWVALAGGLLLWAVGESGTHDTGLGQWGLLTAYPPVWYAGAAIVIAVAAYAFFRPTVRVRLIAAAVSTIVVIQYASAPLIEALPRYPWVYKHIDVTDFITSIGGVDRSIDLYNRWPGFFASSAVLGNAIGLNDALDYAKWADLGFALFDMVAVVAIARVFLRSSAKAWAAGLIFTLINWIGANYYSPQAWAFALYLTMCLVLLTFLRGEPFQFVQRLERFLMGRGAKPLEPLPVVRYGRTARTLAIIAVLVLDAMIVVSHQLTPYAAILTVLPLALLGYLRPRWIGFAMAVITIAYLIPNLGFVQSNWGLLSSFDPLKNLTFKPPATAAAQATPTLGFIVETQAVNVINLLSIGLGLIGMVRRFRSGDPRSAVTVAWFAFASALILAVQTYGGEGRLRVLLLSFAWTSIGAIWALWPDARATLRRSRVMVSGLVVVLLGLFVVAFFQPEADYRIAPADAAAGTWINSVLRDGDSVVGTLPVFPDVVGPNYAPLLAHPATDVEDYFLNNPQYFRTANDVRQLAIKGGLTNDLYVVFSQSQYTYAQAHHLVSAPLLAPLERSVRADPGFVEVYHNAGVQIFRLSNQG